MSLLDGFVKGISGLLPQDDPDVKILNAQAELKELANKEEKTFARLGRQAYEADGGESYPELKAELVLLLANRKEAEARLQTAKDEKAALERIRAEEEARREMEEKARSCPNCGSYSPAGTNFCQGCGARLDQPVQQTTVAKRFCPNCGTEAVAGYRFCSGCGTKMD